MIDEMFCVEWEALEHMSTYICGEHKALEHMKILLEMLGISSGTFHVDFEHNLWSIRSLTIVSLGVSYKYILALVLSKNLWNCNKFVTPCLSVEYGI